MYKNIKLSASLMCADWLNLKNQIKDLEDNSIDYIHYDVLMVFMLQILLWDHQLLTQ